MRRSLSVLSIVLALLLTSSLAAAPQESSTTVLVTMQPDVDVWMPVSRLIAPDADGRLYWGQIPIQTFGGISRDHAWVEVAQPASVTASSIIADVVNDEAWQLPANGWLTGSGQMIYYDRKEPYNCIAGACHSPRVRITGLRAPGTIGSIFSALAVGTKLFPARMYLIADAHRPLQLAIPAGSVLTRTPQQAVEGVRPASARAAR